MPGHDDQFEGRSAYVLVLGEFSIQLFELQLFVYLMSWVMTLLFSKTPGSNFLGGTYLAGCIHWIFQLGVS